MIEEFRMIHRLFLIWIALNSNRFDESFEKFKNLPENMRRFRLGRNNHLSTSHWTNHNNISHCLQHITCTVINEFGRKKTPLGSEWENSSFGYLSSFLFKYPEKYSFLRRITIFQDLNNLALSRHPYLYYYPHKFTYNGWWTSLQALTLL